MLFNSWVFVAFFVMVLPAYYCLAHRWQNVFLVAASYVFYGAWDWRFTSLLALSTVLDFFLARAIENAPSRRRKRVYLAISVSTGLGILGFFKYFNFFVDSAAALLVSMGLNPNTPLLNVILPVGISFYTFQTISYTIDVYRGQIPACRTFVDFALFVAYFPQLVAGPIERAGRLLPQIQRPRRVGQEQWDTGAQLILWGYVKKVAIADGLAPFVEAAFRDPAQTSALGLWIGLYCFALQIYGDFSGYSDIARGVSRLVGIELMVNFRQPYLSRNITEFWRRWHISLSTWLRDYLYIPLGGNRQGVFNQYKNLMITMLLGGMWHGANWTFIVWGGLHGVFLAAHKWFTRGRRIGIERPPTHAIEWMRYGAQLFVTFHLVCLTWVFFRAPSLAAASEYLAGMISPLLGAPLGQVNAHMAGALPALVFYGVLLALLDLGCWLRDDDLSVSRRTAWWIRGVAYAGGLLVLAFVRAPSGESFIYFQF